MDLDAVRAGVESGRKPLRITTHAQVEAFKDGLTLADLREVFQTGTIIEDYPGQGRALILGRSVGSKLPAHIIIEESADEVVIVTAYIPDDRLWIEGRRRRPRS